MYKAGDDGTGLEAIVRRQRKVAGQMRIGIGKAHGIGEMRHEQRAARLQLEARDSAVFALYTARFPDGRLDEICGLSHLMSNTATV